MSKPAFKFPTRLALNKGVVGPDHPGCINSGFAPAMLKSEHASAVLGKPLIVGGSYVIKYARFESVLAASRGKRTEDMKQYKVRFFKTYAAAKKHFLKLMEPVAAQHEEARKAVKALKAAKPGTPEQLAAYQNASDYGVA